jgi:hypothetical protein
MATYDEWKDKYGLLNPERGTPTENAILVTLEYQLLAGEIPAYTVIKVMDYFQTPVRGLYTQTHYGKKADHGEEGLEPNSHDNITAMMVAFKLLGAEAESKVKNVWSYIVANKGTYDFRHPNEVRWDRLLHPRDLIFYGYLAGNILCTLLLPLLIPMMLHSCLKPREVTSGKLLWWVRCHCLPKPFFWLFHKLVDYKDAFRIYFHQEGHPITELLKEETK